MNEYEKQHNQIMRGLGAECAVLLRSNGAFPLDGPCEIALYGNGARNTIKGGTGSGEVNSRYSVTVEAGLEAAGFTITTTSWMDEYDKLYAAARKQFVRDLKKEARRRHTIAVLEFMGATMPEPEYELPLDGAGDTAIYVLSRISGEGSDRKPVAGDILLTATEIRDILALNEQYEHFLLVLNVGGVVDLSPVAEVGNILLLSQLGVETGSIVADIVLGASNPSGKLTTTWSAWGDYPQVGQFGERDDTRYNEGIYVGYRYFDSVGKKALFPFGFGLSYTTFALSAGEATERDGVVTVAAEVTNTGVVAGKEVVQLYASSPAGRLDKPYQALAAFAKTDLLQPGETAQVELSFDLRGLASYDAEGARWVLEAGDYVLRLGTSSVDTEPVALVRLDGEATITQVKNLLGTPDFSDWKPEAREAEELPALPVIAVSASAFTTEVIGYDAPEDIEPMMLGLKDEELCYLGIGAFNPSLGAMSIIGNAAQSVAGAAGETTSLLKEQGIPAMIMADGPAGLRIARQYTKDDKGVHAVGDAMPESIMELMPAPVAFFMKLTSGKGKVKGEVFEQYCTAIPIGTAVAQSWNLDFAEQCGDVVGDEMERFGVHLWLAPALNIHRDIRCGRNFEYFSEDPLISGKFSAAITKGVQAHPGRATTIKHFAANNQETNRYNNNSMVSERAMRELYLRGFEIAVKESQPHALMTSYNLLNGTHTSENRGLVQDILRREWGFEGIVMTDWIIAVMTGKSAVYAAPDAAKIAAAGNDITMPGGPADHKAMMAGIANGTVTRKQLQVNATRIYRMAKKLVEGC